MKLFVIAFGVGPLFHPGLEDSLSLVCQTEGLFMRGLIRASVRSNNIEIEIESLKSFPLQASGFSRRPFTCSECFCHKRSLETFLVNPRAAV
jgi:hypothetical protein